MHIAHVSSPLGRLTLAAEEGALIGLWMEGQRHFPALPAGEAGESAVLTAAGLWLEGYFSGRAEPVPFPLSPRGTAFQRQVWQLLSAIPYGEVTTYGALARELAKRRGVSSSARAVGGAVGHNPISILIPCHRVIGADGSLTGYAGGPERKAFLLSLERGEQKFTVPSPARSGGNL